MDGFKAKIVLKENVKLYKNMDLKLIIHTGSWDNH